jgi:hypothetical protein
MLGIEKLIMPHKEKAGPREESGFRSKIRDQARLM